MDSNVEIFFQSLESDNNSLTDQVTIIEAENHRLIEQCSILEKALEKQKKFHRKFAEDVVATESIRIEDFKKTKRSLIEDNKSLTIANRQLTKDALFYKQAYDELAKEDGSANSNQLPETSTSESTSMMNTRQTKSASSSSTKCTSTMTSSSQIRTANSPRTESSKILSKMLEKLFADNKKLKLKVDGLTKTIRCLKTANQKLENFKKKIDNKKLKYVREADELSLLVASTERKNKDTFNREVLAKLAELVTGRNSQ